MGKVKIQNVLGIPHWWQKEKNNEFKYDYLTLNNIEVFCNKTPLFI